MVLHLAPAQYDDQHPSAAATLQVNLVEKHLKNYSKLVVPALGKVSWSCLHQLILYIALGLHLFSALSLLNHHLLS